MKVHGTLWWLVGAAVACELLGCASAEPGRRGLPQSMGTAGVSGANGANGGNGGASGFGNAGAGAGAGGAAGAAGGSPNDCGGMTYEGEVKGKLDMFVVFDMSGSMFGALATGGAMMGPTVFEATSAALKTFVAAPESSGIGVALRSFSDMTCDAATLTQPEVPMADLPGNGGAIAAWLDAQWTMYGPQNMGTYYSTTTNYMGTQTHPGLQGGIDFMTQWGMDHPESKIVVLLVTDGAPDDDCGTVDDLNAIAADGLSRNIPTYVIGLGDIAVLNGVAAAGGTGQAFIVNDPSAASGDIADKLNTIRGAAQPLPCEFLIPQGGERTPDLVNLDYAGIGAAALERMPRVDSAAGCGATLAWHYDNPAAPTTVVACPDACTKFVNEGGQVSIALGCPTVVID
jgi:hypothetical protein